MDDKIKKSYEKINISESAKNRIQMAVMMDEGKHYEKSINRRWRLVAAACLSAMIVIPTGVYAAHKIYQYFTATISTNDYRVDMQIDKESTANPDVQNKMRYIKVTADVGDDYILDFEDKGELAHKGSTGAMTSYEHKDGFESAKGFWYELEYMDGDKDDILSTYDVETNEQLTINGRKALYCRYNDVVGSEYSEDYKTDYGQSVYIFVEDYGYIIRVAGQKGLSKEDFIELAGKLQISEVYSADDATGYVLYSNKKKIMDNADGNVADVEEIDMDCYHTDGQAKLDDGSTVKVVDVQIYDSVTLLNEDAFIKNQFKYNKLVDKNGKLKKYNRELISKGNGITEPKTSVNKTESIQPKLVYITAEVEGAVSASDEGDYQVPSLQLVKEESGSIHILDELTDNRYNRPKYISHAIVDRMPCYFEESLGGKAAWFTKITGDKMTLNFAYLVDGDMTDKMALCLNKWEDSRYKKHVYIDISR